MSLSDRATQTVFDGSTTILTIDQIDFDRLVNPDRATLCCAPGAGGWGIAIGGYPALYVQGFDSAHSAYMWCVQALLVDPLASHPERFRKAPKKPQTEADSIQELPLFTLEETR